ncbi:DUF2510 domain-containing protein [Streptomyces tsukubensis]|uniref:DUF2510 domain-containing protein n=1 Tax=Streptomyces tsukubensis TaxID=83656 RepID=A0A1V4AEN9_9ACTN|nr:DUF2510 domain-containing protein [Streptomyces tsukubensis]OON81801.1 hypothetical protein B1H18_06750 [Streptomyces tsukubensis]QFR96590.1 DUF2510 domain-containing protein [Streptomyces tsukubensis]
MTQVTPPGWYPDPGHTGEGPRSERWWDGNVWTERTRPTPPTGFGPPAPPARGPYEGQAPGHPQPPQPPHQDPYQQQPYPAAYQQQPYPGQQPYGAPQPPPGQRRGLRTAIAVGVAVVVLAGIGGGVYALSDGDGDETARSSAAPSAPERSQPPGGRDDNGQKGLPGEGGGEGLPGGGDEDDGWVTDGLSGVELPVPDGWTGDSSTASAQAGDSYPCPGAPSKDCVRGGMNSLPAALLKIKATTAEGAAKEDIANNAKDSYGGTTYGSVTSHRQLAAKSVTVAGQKGYMVRWKVVTSKGDDGYVESLAFPSPAKPDRLVLVRFGLDVSEKAPSVTTLDTIAKGIKKGKITMDPGTSSGSGGSGESVRFRPAP